MTRRLGPALLAVGLALTLVWPAVATVRAAWRPAAGVEPPGGGLLVAAPADVERGVRRPFALAAETARLAAVTALLALPPGVALAFVLFRTDAWGRRPALGVLAVSAFVPMPLHASAWLGAFGNAGRMQALGLGARPLLAGWAGAAFVHAMAALPWVVLLAGVGLLAVEPELEESAWLDLPAWRVVLGVTLRRALGGVAAAALAVMVMTAGDMTVTDLLQVRTYAEEAYYQYAVGRGAEAAAAVTVPPLLVVGGLVGVAALGLLRTEPARLPSPSTRARVWRLGRWLVPVGVATLALVAALAGLPLATLAWRAGRVGGDAALGRSPQWSPGGLAGTIRLAWADASGPLTHSALLAAATAALTVPFAWGLAWQARRPGVWRVVAAVAVALALATPGPVVGMALVYAYLDVPEFYDSSGMVILAGVVRTFPYALLLLWPAVRTIPPEFLETAAVSGYGPAGRVWCVAVPLTRRAAVAAGAVAFTLALGELPATNLVAPPALSSQTPLSVVIWSLLHTGVESRTAGVVLVTLGAAAAAGLVAVLAVASVRRAEAS